MRFDFVTGHSNHSNNIRDTLGGEVGVRRVWNIVTKYPKEEGGC
jgi:hypothetical protein